MTTQVIMLMLLSFPLWANTSIESRIHDVDYGIQPHEDTLVLLENGKVLRIKDKEKSFLLDKGIQLKLSFDKNNYLKSVSESDFASEEEVLTSEAPSSQPTLVESMAKAELLFKDMRRARGESECFNRAHVWSYELFTKHQIVSQKMFIFFTIRYIREHDFEWWFHVAPMILVNENSKMAEKVIDRTFSKGPRDIEAWKTIFIGKDIQCPTVTKYSDQADYPFTNDCYFMKAPMHVHQPLDLEMQEVWSVYKTEFTVPDLTAAYDNAFGMKYNGGF